MNKIQKWFHDVLGWGYPTTIKEADSFQSTYHCKYCDGKLAQDSQGNWFHLTNGVNNG